jgi:hypothetical protein
MKVRSVFILILVFWVLVGCLYGWFLRDWVTQAYEGSAPAFFTHLINEIYPRFAVEKHRFPLAFFLNKADQIFIRGSFVLLVASLAFVLTKHRRWQKFTTQPCSLSHIRLLRILFYLGLLYYTWDWIVDLQKLTALQTFYKPILLFQLLHLPLTGFWVFIVIYSIYLLSVLCSIFNIKPIFSAVVVAAILTLMQGYFFSFEKIDHGYATLTYAALLMPFLLAETKHSNHQQILNTWSLPAIQTVIAGAYFVAGLEKLFTGGLSWATAHTFRTYLYLHQVPLGLEVAKSEFLSTLFPLLALLFQLGFILIVFFPILRYILLPGGIAFHVGTVLLFHIGAYFTPWLFVYIFYINWGWVIDKLFDYTLGKKFLNLLRLKLPKTI